jgi:hypothetical protein
MGSSVDTACVYRGHDLFHQKSCIFSDRFLLRWALGLSVEVPKLPAHWEERFSRNGEVRQGG